MYINLFTSILLCFSVNTILLDMWNNIQTIKIVALWDVKVKKMLGWTWIKLFYKLVLENESVFSLFKTVC